MRMKALIVANWKMHPATYKEAKQLFAATKKAAEKAAVTVVIAPPALYLRELAAQYKGKRIGFAAQNAHAGEIGSFTGEVSFGQVRDAKASYVIIGHAERRAMGESDADVGTKVSMSAAEKLTPIICVGENERASDGSYFTRVREQLRMALADVQPPRISQVVIAYEPVWAIGAPRPMSARDMHEMAIFIRKTIVETHGEAGMHTRILYGGAIDDTNAAEMLSQGDVDGLLVGRASHDGAEFARLLASLA